jgi:hypothetical protein
MYLQNNLPCSSKKILRKENYSASFREEKKDLIKGNEPRGVIWVLHVLADSHQFLFIFRLKNEKITIYEFYKGLMPS